jgi:hypothetical protein
MEEFGKTNRVGHSAMKAGMDRKTARKYIKTGCCPAQLAKARDWKTRPDPFEGDWPNVVQWLKDSPGLDAKTIFEMLCEAREGSYEPGQLRTLQRKVRLWRAAAGPEREVMFGQAHRPGEAAQTDFTWATELKVTIIGEAFMHMLCVLVLPYSNWQWATVCLTESLIALRRGVQSALFNLGRVPKVHQTDNSTAATHEIPKADVGYVPGQKRPFNVDYLALMRHFSMQPRTTEVGAKEQNGDVEAGHRALKHRLDQALLRRGSRDFPSKQAWQEFVDAVVRKANQTRSKRLEEELAVMPLLDVAKLPEYREFKIKVSSWSTIRVKRCAYSVPSRLINERVVVHVYEDHVEVYFNGLLQLQCPRLRAGDASHRVDYRHVIWSLVRKPGAFARYVYREELFPGIVFRRTYDAITAHQSGTRGDLEYLRILHLAASNSQSDVEAALDQLLGGSKPITSAAVKALVLVPAPAPTPALISEPVDLMAYDTLLQEVAQ